MSLVSIATFRFGLTEARAEAVVKIARERYATDAYLVALDKAATDYLVELSDDEVGTLQAETVQLLAVH